MDALPWIVEHEGWPFCLRSRFVVPMTGAKHPFAHAAWIAA